ncbi:MaoC family dehydratase N-terminal domain-containing protein [Cryptosporangium sp. NPDC048952]|uniref:FAS1-like dehydratase domain-containing protein n=1 Tax=Cryptosporangium sp. NPDC048952 TaxID=3363961 RepID=UPI00371C6751
MSQLEYQVALSDEMVDAAQQLEGMRLRVEPWNEEATLDTIRHYAHGIGDPNPLWSSEAYAKESVFGDVIAPPTFLYSAYDGAIGLGFEGVQPIYAGTEWTFHQRVRRNDRIRAEAVMGPATVHSGGMAPRFAIQRVNISYLRVGDDALVAEAVASTFRVPRAGADQGLRYEARAAEEYTDADFERLGREAREEPIRGAETRYVEDVRVGDPIPSVLKGPLQQITMTAYYAGCIGSPGYKADEMSWWYRYWAVNEPERLPNNYDPTYFSERVLPSLGHQNAEVAREIGMPGAYGNGPQKCGWLAHPVTNWMGDEGELKQYAVRLRRPDIFGDLSRCSGTVTAVDPASGEVRIALRAVNQADELTAEGSAVVELRRRGTR